MNPWKMTAIGMALVIATAVATGLVVANWSGREADKKFATAPAFAPRTFAQSPAPRIVVPTQATIEACNRFAAAQAAQDDKTREVAKDTTIGAGAGDAVEAAGVSAGTLYGLSQNKQGDPRYRDAYSVCMRSRGYTS